MTEQRSVGLTVLARSRSCGLSPVPGPALALAGPSLSPPPAHRGQDLLNQTLPPLATTPHLLEQGPTRRSPWSTWDGPWFPGPWSWSLVLVHALVLVPGHVWATSSALVRSVRVFDRCVRNRCAVIRHGVTVNAYVTNHCECFKGSHCVRSTLILSLVLPDTSPQRVAPFPWKRCNRATVIRHRCTAVSCIPCTSSERHTGHVETYRALRPAPFPPPHRLEAIRHAISGAR